VWRVADYARHSEKGKAMRRKYLLTGGVFLVALLIWEGPELAGAARGASTTCRPSHTIWKTALQREKSPKTGGRQDETEDQRATRLALAAHDEAAAISTLPRFSYQVRYRHGTVDSMRAIDVSLDQLEKGLIAPVLDKDWIGWFQTSFSWDEKRFLWELSPEDANLNYDFRFWTTTDAWERHEAKDKSSVNFVRSAGPAKFWRGMHLFDYSYLRLTPRRFWWGQTVHPDQCMSPVPPEKATWKNLGVAQFGGETCDVAESPERAERFWISQQTGHVRGVLSYRFTGFDGDKTFYQTEAVQRITGKQFASKQEYWKWLSEDANEDQLLQAAVASCMRCSPQFPSNTRLNELVQFDDYREIKPGVWIPFREVRTVPYSSKSDKNKRSLTRTELRVEEVKTDRNLADRYAQLLPTEGQRVQDQRFIVPVDYNYSVKRTDEEIIASANTEYQKRLKGQKEIQRLLQPIEAMVGKPAPALPATGWVGGKRPDLARKPYLLHFWATWCGPCKNDLPRLKTLAAKGAIIVGMHPPGTPSEEVEKVIRDQQLGYSTFLAADTDIDAKNPTIAGYPAGVFPYSILVDADGKVAAHGFLSDLLGRIDVDKVLMPRKDMGE
jgi:thiol-disulfide isomerase/thioredoxin